MSEQPERTTPSAAGRVRTRRAPATVAAVALATVVAVALLVAGPWRSGGTSPPPDAADPARATPGLGIATTTTLPIPEALPADVHAPTEPAVLGRIQIPALGVDADLQSGMTLTAIDRGPAWWTGTAMPGELGNVVVAGHRTVASKPFEHLDRLRAGDQVVFSTPSGRFVYEVRGVIVVPADWIDIAVQSYAHTATLFACHPPGSATERIVAKLRMLGPDGAPVDPDDALPPLDAESSRTDHTLLVRIPAGTDPSAVATDDPFAGTGG